MDTAFLDQMAQHLKNGRSAACRRAIERVLTTMKRLCEGGQYASPSQAGLDFRKLVDEELACRTSKSIEEADPGKRVSD